MKRALWCLALCGCGSRDPEPRGDVEPRRTTLVRPPDAAPPDATPRQGRQIGVLPEDGPHPDYPSARHAGTEDLFFLEEPARGPHVTKVKLPARKTLALEDHAHCEIDEVTVVCGREPAAAKDRASVSVGRDRGRPVLVEWRRGKQIDQTVVMTYDDTGAIEQMARLDETGTLDWVRTYAPAGQRYTARRLDGSNALDGCGAIELAADNGRVTKRTCLQWLGDAMRDINGVVTTVYDRDADGFVVAASREAFGGRLAVGVRDFVHRIAITRDKRGRRTQERYQAVAGHPVGNADHHGCAGLDFVHERNQELERRCIDVRGELAGDEDGVAVIARERDGRGCEIVTRYRDDAGGMATRDGIHRLELEVDARCLVEQHSCFGSDEEEDRVACEPDGPATYAYVRDKRGRITSSTCYGIDRSRTVDPDYGVSEVREGYDDLGRKVEIACFDLDERAIECGDIGFHRMITAYDGNGRATEERFFAADGSVASNLGTFARRYTYDNYDHESEAQEYGDDGVLTDGDGMAIKRSYYDDSHRLFGMALLDSAGKPARYEGCFVGVRCPGGDDTTWHAVRLMRSPMGRVIANAFFDEQGQLIETVDCKLHQCWTE